MRHLSSHHGYGHTRARTLIRSTTKSRACYRDEYTTSIPYQINSVDHLKQPFIKHWHHFDHRIIIIIIINKVLITVTLNKVIAGALYIVVCG